MNLIVVGCGRVGAELSYRLFLQGHQVTVVDQVQSALENLPADFRGRTVVGEVLTPDVLHRAGIEEAHGLAAVTNSDAVNAVVGHLARTHYHVQNVVVRGYNSRQRPLVESFGLQLVSPSSWGAQRIEEMLSGNLLRTVFSAGNGEVEVYEMVVPDAWDGHKLGEAFARNDCILVALSHAGQAVLPDSEAVMRAGDVVHFSATRDGAASVRGHLGKAQEG